MSAFIQQWEYETTKEFLCRKFGKDYPDSSEIDQWREAETAAILSSPLFAMQNYYTIANKSSDFTTLKPWACQLALHIAIESQRSQDLKQQIVEIKPRQIGYTTYLLARGLWRAMHPNTKVSIMVIEERVADELSKTLATMWNNIPPFFRPMKRIDNLKFVVFDNPNSIDRAANPGLNSTMFIGVPTSQRGRTPHMVVASEYAFWDVEQQEEFMKGLVAPMSMRGVSCVVIDTTPNGHDEGYEPLVRKAIKDNPKWVKRWMQKGIMTIDDLKRGALGEPDRLKGFVPIFWPWRWHEEYTTRDENPMGELPKMTTREIKEVKDTLGKIDRYGKEDEKDLYYKQDVSVYRIWWRRQKMDSYEQPDQRIGLLTFRQEFANDWESCFVDYELSPFDPISLEIIRKQVRPPAARGILRRGEHGLYIDQGWHSDHEELRIYAPPKDGEFYVMGVDTQIAFESEQADNTVAQVLRIRDKKVVATYQAKVPQYRLRESLKNIYDWYNQCYYAIESQGIGYGLIRECMDIGMHNTYYWKRLDRDMPEESHFPGWQTDARSRPIMEQAFIELLEAKDPNGGHAPAIIIPDSETVQELLSVKRDAMGKIKASSNAHDDHVDALMIACAMCNDQYLPYPRDGRTKKKELRKELNSLVKRWNMISSPSNRNNPNLEDL